LAGVPTVTGLYTLSLVATSLNGHFTQTFKIRVN
jgi:hypothetical protein